MPELHLCPEVLELRNALRSIEADLRVAERELKSRGLAKAKAELAFKIAWSSAVATARVDGLPVEAAKAFADGAAAQLRHDYTLADSLERSALEAVRSARQRISAWQTEAALIRGELDLARSGPSGR